MDRWSQLSIKDKSDLMSLYIRNGISSLEEIKKHYNSFATGGQMNTDGSKEDKNKKKPDEPPTRTYNIPMVQPMVSTIDPMGGIGYQAAYYTHEQEMRRAAAEAEAQRREAERIARQPVLRADTRTQADRDRAAKQRKQDEYNRMVNEQKDRLMSVGRPNTESTQAAILAMPYVAEAAKNYVQNFDPTAEIRNAMYFVPGVSNVMMAQDARTAFDNNQTGTGVVNAAFALAPMLGVTPNFKSPLRYTRPANRVGDWTILDYGRNTTTTPVQSSTTPMLSMPNTLRLSSVERPSLSARPTQGRIGTTNRLQLPEMTESFRALENEAFGEDYLRSLYLNDGRIAEEIRDIVRYNLSHPTHTKPSKTRVLLPEDIKPQIRPLIKGAEIEKQLSKAGTISRKSLDAYIAKQGKYYQEVMNETLESDFKGVDKIDYTDFQNAVQKRLPEYNRIIRKGYEDYGVNRLGFYSSKMNIYDFAREHDYNIESSFGNGTVTDIFISPDGERYTESELSRYIQDSSPLLFNTYSFETPGIVGNPKHYKGNTIGHSRTYTNIEEPDILHVMESQSDWAQDKEELLGASKRNTHMINTYTERQIQENLKYAAEQGQTKMRYPTRETAAKIEGYPYRTILYDQQGNRVISAETRGPELDAELENLIQRKSILESEANLQEIGFIPHDNTEYYNIIDRIAEITDIPARRKAEVVSKREYDPNHETILKKYDAFPKQFQKLFGKKAEVRTVTDSKGNTWYEVDVPESYRNGTGQIIFSLGGLLGAGALTDK